MARPTIQSTEWDFSVKQVALMTPDGRRSGFYGNMREDTGEVLGCASEHYGILQNNELFNKTVDVLAQKGLTDYTAETIVTGGGAKFFAEFTFKNKQLACNVGDLFGYVLRLQNSFDRSLRASFELGMLRLTCLNGNSTLEKEFGDTRKHSSKVNVEFLGDAIDRAFLSGKRVMETYDRLADKAITNQQGTRILGNLVGRGLLSGSLRENMETLWLAPSRKEDEARNLWNLYNAVTEHLTHGVKSDRFEYANKTSRNVLMILDNAASKPDTFDKLIAPVKEDESVVVVA